MYIFHHSATEQSRLEEQANAARAQLILEEEEAKAKIAQLKAKEEDDAKNVSAIVREQGLLSLIKEINILYYTGHTVNIQEGVHFPKKIFYSVLDSDRTRRDKHS